MNEKELAFLDYVLENSDGPFEDLEAEGLHDLYTDAVAAGIDVPEWEEAAAIFFAEAAIEEPEDDGLENTPPIEEEEPIEEEPEEPIEEEI